MNEKLTTLVEEMAKNEKLQGEIKGAKDLDALYAVTTKYVDGYTKDELKDLIEKLKREESGELSDNDLDAVAGGISLWESYKMSWKSLFAFLKTGNPEDAKDAARKYYKEITQ